MSNGTWVDKSFETEYKTEKLLIFARAVHAALHELGDELAADGTIAVSLPAVKREFVFKHTPTGIVTP